jgi:hypothetical protein
MDSQVVQELAAIRSLVTIVAWVVAGIVAVMIANVIFNFRSSFQNFQTVDFFTRGNSLLSRGELENLLKLCETHLLEFPADAGALWLKGSAHYRKEEWSEALLCYRKVDELQPGFAIGPSITEIEEKIGTAATVPLLKVVPPADSLNVPAAQNHDGDA